MKLGRKLANKIRPTKWFLYSAVFEHASELTVDQSKQSADCFELLFVEYTKNQTIMKL